MNDQANALWPCVGRPRVEVLADHEPGLEAGRLGLGAPVEQVVRVELLEHRRVADRGHGSGLLAVGWRAWPGPRRRQWRRAGHRDDGRRGCWRRSRPRAPDLQATVIGSSRRAARRAGRPARRAGCAGRPGDGTVARPLLAVAHVEHDAAPGAGRRPRASRPATTGYDPTSPPAPTHASIPPTRTPTMWSTPMRTSWSTASTLGRLGRVRAGRARAACRPAGASRHSSRTCRPARCSSARARAPAANALRGPGRRRR